MKKLILTLIILGIFILSAHAQTTKYESISVKKQITLSTILLKDSSGTFYINKPVWLKDSLKLGSIFLKDSSNFIVINKLPIFPNLPWIKEWYFSDTSISAAKIKKGSITSAELSTGFKDTLFTSSVYGLSSRVDKIEDSISVHESIIQTKLSKIDTLTLSNRINTKLTKSDTLSLSDRINTKLNSSDTTAISNRITNLKTSYNTLFTDAGYFIGDSIPLGTRSLKFDTNGNFQIDSSYHTKGSYILDNDNGFLRSTSGYWYLGKTKNILDLTLHLNSLYGLSLGNYDDINSSYYGLLLSSSGVESLYADFTNFGGKWNFTDSIYFKNSIVIDSSLIINGRIQGSKGTDINSANNIILGNANYFELTGVIDVYTIDSSGWKSGSIVTLMIKNGLTLKNETSGTYTQLLLNKNSDFVAVAGSVITLVYDGTYWREINRSSN